MGRPRRRAASDCRPRPGAVSACGRWGRRGGSVRARRRPSPAPGADQSGFYHHLTQNACDVVPSREGTRGAVDRARSGREAPPPRRPSPLGQGFRIQACGCARRRRRRKQSATVICLPPLLLNGHSRGLVCQWPLHVTKDAPRLGARSSYSRHLEATPRRRRRRKQSVTVICSPTGCAAGWGNGIYCLKPSAIRRVGQCAAPCGLSKGPQNISFNPAFIFKICSEI